MRFARAVLSTPEVELPPEVWTSADVERRLAPLYGRLRLPEVAGQPLPLPLKTHEHALLLAFAERAQGLPGARRNELADLASPLTGCSGEASTRQLYALANGLLGRQ